MSATRRLIWWFSRIFLLLILLAGLLVACLILLEKRWGAIIVDHSLASLNEQLQVPISTSRVDFTFFENFPHASLHLRNVVVSSSHPEVFGRNDTLLMVRSLFLILNPFDLLRGDYRIVSVKLSQGYLNLRHGSKGAKNYDILKPSFPDSPPRDVRLLVNHFQLEQISFSLRDPAAQLTVRMLVSSLTARGQIGREQSDLSVEGEGLVEQIRQGDFLFSLKQSFSVTSKVQVANSTIRTENTQLHLDRNRLRMQGHLDLRDYTTKLTLRGSNIDLRTVLSFASQHQFTLPRTIEFKGLLSADLSIEGGMRKQDRLRIAMGLAGENISMRYEGKNYTLTTIQGQFSNGQKGSKATSFLEITKCKVQRESSEIDFQFNLANLERPTLYTKFAFQLQENEVHIPLFATYVPHYELIRGEGEFLASVHNPDSLTLQSFVDPKIRLDVDFENITVTPNPHQTFSELYGSITLTDEDLTKGSVQGKWGAATFNIGLHAKNILSLLTRHGRSEWSINTSLSGWEIPDNFIPAWNPSHAGNDSSTLAKRNLWDDVQVIQGDLFINNCTYRGGRIDSLEAHFSANERDILIRIGDGRMLNGRMRGRIEWRSLGAEQQMLNADLYPQQIDLKELFYRFDNFRQSAITSNNITGHLSGTISLYAPLNNWRLNYEALQMRANVSVQKGSLVNVKGLERLASFISLEELKNIQFSTLSNEISVYNQLITIPSMRVNSSAINLTLAGEQHFDSRYRYHVGLNLSDLLFNKLKSRRREIDDNAVKNDTERGGASLFLILEGDSTGSNVRFDRVALGNWIGKMVEQEKETLQGLLNEEFQWSLGDSLRKAQPAPTKPSYTIEWADDSVQPPPTKPPAKPKKKPANPPPTIIWEDE